MEVERLNANEILPSHFTQELKIHNGSELTAAPLMNPVLPSIPEDMSGIPEYASNNISHILRHYSLKSPKTIRIPGPFTTPFCKVLQNVHAPKRMDDTYRS